jgi:hypothetical protein
VRAGGLEPPPACADQILSLAPIPVRLRPRRKTIPDLLYVRGAKLSRFCRKCAGLKTRTVGKNVVAIT